LDEEDKEVKKDDRAEEEELFFDGENYLTKEEFFNPPDEWEKKPVKKKKRRFKVIIASIVTAALLANVLAVWPQMFNLPAVEFLSNARELAGNEEVQEYKDSVVVVRTEDSKGTGFVFGDGYIMTNEHVIRGSYETSIHFEDGDSYAADTVTVNETLDIAVLKPEAEEFPHPPLELASGWESSESIYIIGNPRFFNFIPNEGKLIEPVERNGREDVIALDAPVYRGSSGSPVITEEGNVAGVVYATTRREINDQMERVGLAVDMEFILEEMNIPD
jgi:serine protease Do